MQIIAIVNEKGGTGKTTTSVSLSAALGEMGKRVLLVDLDGQAASSRWLGVEEDSRLADALLAGGGLEPLADIIPGVSLAPASGKLDSVAHDLRPTQGGQLRRVLMEVADQYDYVLIDCPPSLGNRLIGNALLAATHAIAPVESSILALDGLGMLLTTLRDIREGFDHDLTLIGALACRYDARTRLSKLVLAELKRALPGKVFKTTIRETVRMQECPASGTSILEYAPDSSAAEDYRALARELVSGQMDMLECTDADNGLAEPTQLPDEDRQALAGFRHRAGKLLQPAAPRYIAPQDDQQDGPAEDAQPEQAHEAPVADEAAPEPVEMDRSQEETPVEDVQPEPVNELAAEETPVEADWSQEETPVEDVQSEPVDELAAEESPAEMTCLETTDDQLPEAVSEMVCDPRQMEGVADDVPARHVEISDFCEQETAVPIHSMDIPTTESQEDFMPTAAGMDESMTAEHPDECECVQEPAYSAVDTSADSYVEPAAEAPPTSSRRGKLVAVLAGTPVLVLALAFAGWRLAGGEQTGPQVATAEPAVPMLSLSLPPTVEPAATADPEPVESVETVQVEPVAAPAADQVPAPAGQVTLPADAAPDQADSHGEAIVAAADGTEGEPIEAAVEPTEESVAPAEPTGPKYILCPPGFSLTCVMKAPSGYMAMINGKAVNLGQTVDGAKIVEITLQAVEMEMDGKRFVLGIGEQTSPAQGDSDNE